MDLKHEQLDGTNYQPRCEQFLSDLLQERSGEALAPHLTKQQLIDELVDGEEANFQKRSLEIEGDSVEDEPAPKRSVRTVSSQVVSNSSILEDILERLGELERERAASSHPVTQMGGNRPEQHAEQSNPPINRSTAQQLAAHERRAKVQEAAEKRREMQHTLVSTEPASPFSNPASNMSAEKRVHLLEWCMHKTTGRKLQELVRSLRDGSISEAALIETLERMGKQEELAADYAAMRLIGDLDVASFGMASDLRERLKIELGVYIQ